MTDNVNQAVRQVIALLREEFPGAQVTFIPDGTGGGDAIIESVDLGPGYTPRLTWLGGRLNPALPFADIYPLFIAANVTRSDGRPHPQPPISNGVTFAGRAALQLSRRTNNLMATVEAAAAKFTKVLNFTMELAA
jgi:hypothetical protein